jgi:hypothetical protein
MPLHYELNSSYGLVSQKNFHIHTCFFNHFQDLNQSQIEGKKNDLGNMEQLHLTVKLKGYPVLLKSVHGSIATP